MTNEELKELVNKEGLLEAMKIVDPYEDIDCDDMHEVWLNTLCSINELIFVLGLS